MSYGLTTFAIAMVFSVIVPYVAIFAMVFFLFKYYVDKYNLTFVYRPEFRGVGIIKRRVVPLSIFNIIVYQLINVGFFASKAENQGYRYLYIGLGVVLAEVITLVVYHFYEKHRRKSSHITMRERQNEHRMQFGAKAKSTTNSMVENVSQNSRHFMDLPGAQDNYANGDRAAEMAHL